MPTKLRVLIVEDSTADAELVLHELRRAGYEPEWMRVETEPDFLAQLDQGWEMILADYNLPEFSGLRALELLRGRDPDSPFIIVSGTIGEDKAVAAIKAGANDYIMKDRLARLSSAIERALRDAVERRERKRATEALRESEERYRILFEGTKQGILVADAQTGLFLYANEAISRMFGYTTEELIRMGVADVHPQESLRHVQSEFEAQIRQEKTLAAGLPCLRKDRTVFYADVNSSPISIGGRQCNVAFFTDITERKRAEEALQESEARYRLLIDTAQFPIVVVSAADLRVLFINEHASRLFGVPAPQAVGQRASAFWFRKEGLYRFVQLIKEHGAVKDFETELLSKSGARMTVMLSSNLIEFTGKQAALTVFQDITDRKQAEEELKRSEERFKLIFEYAPDAYYLNDLKGNFIDGNKAAEKITGYNREELVGGSFLKLNLLSLDQLPKAAMLLAKNAMGKSTGPDEFILKKKGGDKVSTEISTHPVKYENKTIILGIARDISERKRAAEALRESEEKYRTLVENAGEAILIAQDGRLRFVNQAASEITGYSKQELRAAPFLEFIHPDDRQMVGERYLRRIKGDLSLPRYSFRLICKNGSIKWMDISAVVLTWEGKPATLNFLSDITERKQAEEAMRQAENNFRRSLDESPLGVRVVGIKGETLYANRAILDIYGYADAEELRSTPVEKRYTPESYAEFHLRMKKRMTGEDSPEYEISIVRKTGEIRHLLVFRKEISWDGRKQFQAIYQDITERKKIEEKLEETLRGLRNALGGIVQVLSATTEKRDPYTAGHQRRVADLARAIGQEMGLAADRVEGLRLAGTIHDIGKVSIPAEILSKPSRLTEIEYKLIQTHSQAGYDILRDVHFSWPLAEMVLQHHERMNGSGYPQKLKGEDILLEARILAVSDVVEAMASHRPYRPSLGIEAALEEIEKNKGILFDPDVVSVCLTLFREKNFTFKL